MAEKKKGGLALAILEGMGPRESKDKEGGKEEEESEGPGAAGEELKAALDSGDGKAIYDAVKAILDI